jgi:hypothetical protein
MTADTPVIEPGSTPGRRRKRRRKALDGRTRNGRRVKTLTAIYASALGPNLSAVQASDVARAARLMALSEDLQLRRLNGDEAIDVDALVRADSTARRAVRDLGLQPAREAEAARSVVGDVQRAVGLARGRAIATSVQRLLRGRTPSATVTFAAVEAASRCLDFRP